MTRRHQMYPLGEVIKRFEDQGYKVVIEREPFKGARTSVYFKGRPESPRRYTIHNASGELVATATHTASWADVPHA